MKIKLIIITANELRHKFFRRKISSFKHVDVKLCLAEKNSSRQYYKVKLLDSGTKADILNHASIYKASELVLINGVKEQ